MSSIESTNYVFGVTQTQLSSIFNDSLRIAFNNELKRINPPQQRPPSFSEFECRKMKLPRLKYEVQLRRLNVVGTGKGGAPKKLDYMNALLGRQTVGKVVRSLNQREIKLRS